MEELSFFVGKGRPHLILLHPGLMRSLYSSYKLSEEVHRLSDIFIFMQLLIAPTNARSQEGSPNW